MTHSLIYEFSYEDQLGWRAEPVLSGGPAVHFAILGTSSAGPALTTGHIRTACHIERRRTARPRRGYLTACPVLVTCKRCRDRSSHLTWTKDGRTVRVCWACDLPLRPTADERETCHCGETVELVGDGRVRCAGCGELFDLETEITDVASSGPEDTIRVCYSCAHGEPPMSEDEYVEQIEKHNDAIRRAARIEEEGRAAR